MGNDNLQILQLVKQLLQQETNDQGLLDGLSQSLSGYEQNHTSSNNNNQNTQTLQNRITFLEEQLESTIKMAEMTINSLSEELQHGAVSPQYPAINNEVASSFVEPSTHSYGYLTDALFSHEYHLKELIPQSFFIHTSQDALKGSFIWSHEQMGLLYLVYVYCEGHNERRVNNAILCNQFTNEVFLKTRPLDVCSIIQQVDEKFAQVQNQHGYDDQGIQYAVCVVDKVNAKLDFVGANTVLLAAQQHDFQEIPGMMSSLGKIRMNQERCDKHTINIQKGSQFFIIPKMDLIKEQIIQKMREMGRVDFVTQKQNFTQWLNNQLTTNNIQEYFISGFGF